MNFPVLKVESNLHALLRTSQGTFPVRTTLTADSRDPFAVSLTVRVEDDVVWVFARELLEAGLSATSGAGFVQVLPVRAPDGDRAVVLVLHGESGSARLRFARRDVQEFLSMLGPLRHPDRLQDALEGSLRALGI